MKNSKIGRFFRKIKRVFNEKSELQRALDEGMKIGKNLQVLSGVSFDSEPYLIEIGDDVTISHDVLFFNHDGGTRVFRKQEKYKNIICYGKIVIGNNVFIGCIILPGVKIGNNVVIGAGSVVTKNLPSDGVYAGCPARFIESISEYSEKYLNKTKQYNREEYEKNKKQFLIHYFGDSSKWFTSLLQY